MNHNILKKIIDKVALNNWQYKIYKINEEYHCIYICNESIPMRNNVQCIYCNRRMFFVFNYRRLNHQQYNDINTDIVNLNNVLCLHCYHDNKYPKLSNNY